MKTNKIISVALLVLFSTGAPTTFLMVKHLFDKENDAMYETKSGLVVILKADDFAMQPSLKNWIKFFDFLNKNELSAAVGVLGKPLSKKSQEELAEMRMMFEANKNSIELWNHGWSHWSKSTGYEFRGPDKEKQKESVRKTQDLVKEVFGITMKSFGAGNNRTDSNTFSALKEIPEIKIVFDYAVLNSP